MILPSDHHVTRLIVRYLHESNGHSGTNQTLAAVRQHYWNIRGPSTVKRVVSGCIPCRRRNQSPGTQIMTLLPAARLTPWMPPFSSVGIDYFGPLKVKWRRGTANRYGCIFTCLAIRAIHIEISHDFTTDSFIQAVCRFVSRRGPPRDLFSDNGTNFKGAEAEVKQALLAWNQQRIRDQMRAKGIEWNFSPPRASHAGGIWQRMIRSVRKHLHALVGNRLVDDETLFTVSCETETIVNDRPLTRHCDDHQDPSVLPPNTLLLCYRNPCSPAGDLPVAHNPRPSERWKQA